MYFDDEDDNTDYTDRINIDELFEKKHKRELKKLEQYKKQLQKAHKQIKDTSNKYSQRFCWFMVPRIILGTSAYDQASCIAYIMVALKKNGLAVKFYEPNGIFISWEHHITQWERDEFKKKNGIEIDQLGNIIPEKVKVDEKPVELTQDQNVKNFKSTSTYAPKGIYDEGLINSIKHKML